MQRYFTLCLCLMIVFGLAGVGQAHFGVILPDKSMVMQGDNPNLELTLAFCHPFEQNGMDMAKPKKFGVIGRKRKNRSLKHPPGNEGPGQAGLENHLHLEKAGHLRLLF